MHSYKGTKLAGAKLPDPHDSGRPGEYPAANRDLQHPTSAAPNATPPDRGTTGPRNRAAPHDPVSNASRGANSRA